MRSIAANCRTEKNPGAKITQRKKKYIAVITYFVQQLVDQCEDLLAPVQALDTSLENFWTVLDDAGELSSCENVNGLYQAAVYDELCDDLPSGLLGFWVSCVILTVLLLILVSALCALGALVRVVARSPVFFAVGRVGWGGWTCALCRVDDEDDVERW